MEKKLEKANSMMKTKTGPSVLKVTPKPTWWHSASIKMFLKEGLAKKVLWPFLVYFHMNFQALLSDSTDPYFCKNCAHAEGYIHVQGKVRLQSFPAIQCKKDALIFKFGLHPRC